MSDKTTDISGDGGAVAGGAKRFSATRKLAAVQRLMWGERFDAVSREENMPVHRLTAWRDKVLMEAESALKERKRDARDDEIVTAARAVCDRVQQLAVNGIDALQIVEPLGGAACALARAAEVDKKEGDRERDEYVFHDMWPPVPRACGQSFHDMWPPP